MAHDQTPSNRPAAAALALLERIEREGGATASDASPAVWMRSIAHACRAELALRMNETLSADRRRGARRVHYLSMEFLMGRALANALSALGLSDTFVAAARNLGIDTDAVLEREADAALGNGGLGRLAACFLDSLATLGIPSFGYGLRYRFGIFAQRIHNGAQVEEPDDWLRYGNPWELERTEIRYPVGLGGRVVSDGPGRRWLPAETLQAGAFDFVVPGHGTSRVAVLRLWQPAPPPIDLHAFSRGEHVAAGMHRLTAEALGWVLYPDDSTPAGRELRLKQEYFLVCASVQDVLARHLQEHGRLDNLGDAVAIHLNDTHPALAAPELLRLLLDEHNLSWERALPILQRVMSYTNHTLMPEALETWPLHLFEHWLPRHLEIIYEMNHRFLDQVRARFPGDEALVQRVSLINEGDDRRVKMAPVSIVASHKVNGVSQLHSDLMVRTIFADYARVFPDRFINVTNGVTPRRWVAQANPALAAVLDARLGGPAWRTDLDRLAALAAGADDNALQRDVLAAKRANKERLAALVRRELGLAVDPASMFDVQIKRFHEYKRQLLNVLQVIAHYQAIVNDPAAAWTPRTVFFAGKAASAYVAAKDIIRLIHDVARMVNSDRLVQDRLKVVFLPNYGVSLAETIIPAADLSEQISTAGTEASGTGNMKFALNGALTIGTWDGANIEMAEAVGREHFFIFGLAAEQVAELRANGYDPRRFYAAEPRLKAAVDAVASGLFSPGEPDRYRGLIDSLLHRDAYLLFADFPSYLEAHARADRQFTQPGEWARKAILNIAAMGQFSSDRTIREYAQRVWNVPV
jgi:starch phosphorylase